MAGIRAMPPQKALPRGGAKAQAFTGSVKTGNRGAVLADHFQVLVNRKTLRSW